MRCRDAAGHVDAKARQGAHDGAVSQPRDFRGLGHSHRPRRSRDERGRPELRHDHPRPDRGDRRTEHAWLLVRRPVRPAACAHHDSQNPRSGEDGDQETARHSLDAAVVHRGHGPVQCVSDGFAPRQSPLRHGPHGAYVFDERPGAHQQPRIARAGGNELPGARDDEFSPQPVEAGCRIPSTETDCRESCQVRRNVPRGIRVVPERCVPRIQRFCETRMQKARSARLHGNIAGGVRRRRVLPGTSQTAG
ncbi:MAG: hypothetical protein BWY66_02252 [bacterium ADurb.Bin374]|nr:MAG: hypothetical protein BWY66_02252 [bacterium ADurb.Bin374]